jgi:hypothetical protein
MTYKDEHPNPFDDPDYIVLDEIHAALHHGGLTRVQMIDRIQNALAAWAMTEGDRANVL